MNSTSIPKRKRVRRAATAILAAVLGAAALAPVASADPIDVFTMSSGSGLTHFGTNCQPTGAPPTGAALNWQEDVLAGTVEPRMTGDLCRQSPSNGIRTQVILEYINNNHAVVATRPSAIQTGAGGLEVFDVIRGGLPFNSSTVDHVHVRLYDDDNPSGQLQEVEFEALDL